MAKARRELPAAPLYESDYYSWALEQAALLRERRLAELDLDNLAEEVEDLGRSLADQLESRYETLLMHLLKWEFQPERRTRSWAVTIGRERIRLPKRLRKNPGLKARQQALYADAYEQAREEAALETGLPLDRFPVENPYALDQTMDPDFWPGGRELPARDTGRRRR
jgi:hypothetical protein